MAVIKAFVEKETDGSEPEGINGPTLRVDGRRVVLPAAAELVLECGASSITLTREGKIILRGKEIVSRASGTNKVRGASVQIN